MRVDRIGNCYGRRRGRRDDAPVMAGSHIDSVPTARALRRLPRRARRARVRARRSTSAASRPSARSRSPSSPTRRARASAPTCWAAPWPCGRLPLERGARAARPGRAHRRARSCETIGFLGDAPERLAPPHAYVECHIEQGPILRAAGRDLGVVTGVQAISWQEVTIVGKSAHAGTTPMELRRDAGLAAARLNVKHARDGASRAATARCARRWAASIPCPGLVNIVPGRVRCTVDLRNPDDAQMARRRARPRRVLRRARRRAAACRSRRARPRARRASPSRRRCRR